MKSRPGQLRWPFIYVEAQVAFSCRTFTSDRKLLLNAVDQAIPRFPPPNPTYLSDTDTMRQIVISLRQVPGRKNVLWFSGGSTLFLIPNVIPDSG